MTIRDVASMATCGRLRVDFNKLKAEDGFYSALDPTAVTFGQIIYALGGIQVNSPARSR
jgi:hypothetical protein